MAFKMKGFTPFTKKIWPPTGGEFNVDGLIKEDQPLDDPNLVAVDHEMIHDDLEGKDKHAIDAEKINTTGEWCAVCGAHISEHSGKGHDFKVHTPPGPDTKWENADEVD